MAYIKSSECRKNRGVRVYQARRLTGLSIEQFAVKISLAKATLQKLEHGEIDVKVKTLELVALHTGTSIHWLMWGDIATERNNAVSEDYYE